MDCGIPGCASLWVAKWLAGCSCCSHCCLSHARCLLCTRPGLRPGQWVVLWARSGPIAGQIQPTGLEVDMSSLNRNNPQRDTALTFVSQSIPSLHSSSQHFMPVCHAIYIMLAHMCS